MFLIIILVILIILIVLGFYNNQIVTFNFLITKDEFRLCRLLAFLFAMGFVMGVSIGGIFWIKVRISLFYAKRKLKQYINSQTIGCSDHIIK